MSGRQKRRVAPDDVGYVPALAPITVSHCHFIGNQVDRSAVVEIAGAIRAQARANLATARALASLCDGRFAPKFDAVLRIDQSGLTGDAKKVSS